eukprot:jgi/Psemu1/18195/gm1.18195_g
MTNKQIPSHREIPRSVYLDRYYSDPWHRDIDQALEFLLQQLFLPKPVVDTNLEKIFLKHATLIQVIFGLFNLLVIPDTTIPLLSQNSNTTTMPTQATTKTNLFLSFDANLAFILHHVLQLNDEHIATP